MGDIVSEHVVLARTLGVKTFVADGVMLRASYSEGHLPPRSDQVQPTVLSVNGTGYPAPTPGAAARCWP